MVVLYVYIRIKEYKLTFYTYTCVQIRIKWSVYKCKYVYIRIKWSFYTVLHDEIRLNAYKMVTFRASGPRPSFSKFGQA